MHPNNKKCREKGLNASTAVVPFSSSSSRFSSIESFRQTHRNQGCQGTHMGLIQLIMQLSVKNCSKLTVDWSHCSGNFLSRWEKKKKMLTIGFESSFSKTFCAWSGGNLSMDVITLAIVCRWEVKKKICIWGIVFRAIIYHDLKRKNKTEQNKNKQTPSLAVQLHECTHKHKG